MNNIYLFFTIFGILFILNQIYCNENTNMNVCRCKMNEEVKRSFMNSSVDVLDMPSFRFFFHCVINKKKR